MTDWASTDRKLGGTAPFFFRSFPYLTYILYHVFKKMSRPERARWPQRVQRQNNKKNIYPLLLYHIFFILSRPVRLSGQGLWYYPSPPPSILLYHIFNNLSRARSVSQPSRPFVGFSDRSFSARLKPLTRTPTRYALSFSFPPFLIILYHTFGNLSRPGRKCELRTRSALSAKIRAYAEPGRESELGTKINYGKIIRSGEARTFHEKNRIWGTRPENRPACPRAAGRVSLS